MPNDDMPTFGARVQVTAVYRRFRLDGGRFRSQKEWQRRAIVPRAALYIGSRMLSNGVTHYDYGEDGGLYYVAAHHFRAALVVFNERERPVLVPVDALEVL